MRTIRRTSQFRKDVQSMAKRGKEFGEFKGVFRKRAAGKTLKTEYRDHVLVGQFKGTRECHIEQDWLLIYELAESELILVRTGTHSDLFR